MYALVILGMLEDSHGNKHRSSSNSVRNEACLISAESWKNLLALENKNTSKGCCLSLPHSLCWSPKGGATGNESPVVGSNHLTSLKRKEKQVTICSVEDYFVWDYLSVKCLEKNKSFMSVLSYALKRSHEWMKMKHNQTWSIWPQLIIES